ncbi:MAG: hypothetical protein ACOX7U_02760 [Desulfitobacteriia bacterium]
MKDNWRELWEFNKEIFKITNWEECSEQKRKSWRLSPRFRYYSAGDLNLRLGIIFSPHKYKDEEFFQEGILWGSRIGNGMRTILYFVAPDFSPIFLKAIGKIGGTMTAEGVYWREKLTPPLYKIQNKGDDRVTYFLEPAKERPDWEFWQKNLNPVAWNHLKTTRAFFESLAPRRVRTVFEKNKIVFYWGALEIAEIKRKGSKIDLATKVKWTRKKDIVAKYSKSGWVDLSDQINEEFVEAVNGILELLERMEAEGELENKDLLALKLCREKVSWPGFSGKHFEYPWLIQGRIWGGISNLYYFEDKFEVRVVQPILEKPFAGVTTALLSSAYLECSDLNRRGLPWNPDLRWNQKIILLAPHTFTEELRLSQTWLKEPEQFPIYILPEDWKTNQLQDIEELTPDTNEESYL